LNKVYMNLEFIVGIVRLASLVSWEYLFVFTDLWIRYEYNSWSKL
jgi:hypothetical protein